MMNEPDTYSKSGMRKYRDTVFILRDMLVSALRPSSRTSIMYHSFLSYSQLKVHLKQLLDKQLISEKNERYTTTKTGLDFIHKIDEIKKMLDV